ncbi:signal peptidase II [Paenibacillus aurantius]|uniref:Lipoprotein signal peptidase n=1 Tax=Paenibacillus aurantius TaxID=2918900 RepID=A0AA96RKB5_9BACL|nr:signal peptidase II [Paenibacillus aurantius]WNQ14219.1 signal peptidase II [Paenibacillus aurantius]
MVYLVIALLVFLLDQATKWLILTKMELHESISVIGQFFQITSHRNRGAAFGILQEQRWFFLIITFVVVIAILFYLRKMVQENRRLLSIALSLLLGGAAGNFIDRARWGEVVDFLQFTFNLSAFGVEEYVFPIFNVADSAIVVGVALILLDSLQSWLKERKDNAHESHGS